MESKYLILDGISQVKLGLKICNALESAGEQFCYFDPKCCKRIPLYKYRKSIYKRFTQKGYYYHPQIHSSEIENIIRREKPHIILVVGFSYPYISLENLLDLKNKYHFKLILWDSDSVNLLDNQAKVHYYLTEEMPRYDHVYFSSQCMQQFFLGHGFSNTSFLPFAGNVNAPLVNTSEHQKKYDLCFVGDPDMRRLLLLNVLSDYNIIIYGKRWEKFLPIVSQKLKSKIICQNIYGKELQQLTSQSKIILNITKPLSSSLKTGVTERVFDVVANQSFLLSDHCEELANLFEVGKEIITFHNTQELISLVDYYLKNEQARQTVIHHGCSRIKKEHLWQHRLERMLHDMAVC